MNNLTAIIIGLFFLSGCARINPGGVPPTTDSCGWPVSMIDTQSQLGPSDFDAGYNGILAAVRPGARVVISGKYPLARYAALAIYDQDFMLADSLEAAEIEPARGGNPYRPGVIRDGSADFEVTVSMDAKPSGPRPQNTLFAGTTMRGQPNRFMVITWRVYLPDRGLGYRDQNPLAPFGGTEPLAARFFDATGKPYCPSERESRQARARVMSAAFRQNIDKIANPDLAGKPASPPRWSNAAAADHDKATYVPNPYSAYIATAVSDQFGPLLVLRWKPARTPAETFTGAPFPADYDLRYWSISFVDYQPGKNFGFITEKSLADIDLPTLPDGTAQLVVGFGGVAKPDFVPPEQWVGLKMKKGVLIIRNILARPGFGGDFFALPAGPIAAEYDRYTPGGVYCTTDELRADPDLGLRREELMRQGR